MTEHEFWALVIRKLDILESYFDEDEDIHMLFKDLDEALAEMTNTIEDERSHLMYNEVYIPRDYFEEVKTLAEVAKQQEAMELQKWKDSDWLY